MSDPENPEEHDLLTAEQRQMLENRFEAHRRAPETSIPWEEVRARLFALE